MPRALARPQAATFVYPSQSVEESWDLGGSHYPTVTNAYQYGQSLQYGDPTQISVSNSAGAGKTTVNEYWPANTGSGNWILGRLKKAVSDERRRRSLIGYSRRQAKSQPLKSWNKNRSEGWECTLKHSKILLLRGSVAGWGAGLLALAQAQTTALRASRPASSRSASPAPPPTASPSRSSRRRGHGAQTRAGLQQPGRQRPAGHGLEPGRAQQLLAAAPAPWRIDNFRGGVNFDMNDRYCMDGQRLILVSGTYGVAGSEYRTELDSFSKIVASGTAGNGVASFTVQTKAGLTMEYGNTADSRIEAQGKTTRQGLGDQQDLRRQDQRHDLRLLQERRQQRVCTAQHRLWRQHGGGLGQQPVRQHPVRHHPDRQNQGLPAAAALSSRTGASAASSCSTAAPSQNLFAGLQPEPGHQPFQAADRDRMRAGRQLPAPKRVCVSRPSPAPRLQPLVKWHTRFGDAENFNLPQYYNTLQLVDVNNDGLVDLCSRNYDGIYCGLNLGSGAGFGGLTRWSTSFTDAGGLDQPQYYSTIRYPDVNGDGFRHLREVDRRHLLRP